MARGKQTSRSSIAARNKRDLRKLSASALAKDVSGGTPRSEEVIRASIEYHWDSYCHGLRHFLTDNPDNVTLKSLIEFWTRPDNEAYATMNIGPGTSHMLAYEYLNLGDTDKARALIRCGAFLNQLKTVPMTQMVALSSEEELVAEKKLPIYFYAIQACREGKEQAYLRKALPLKYMNALGLENANSNVPSMKYCDFVANDWQGTSSTSSSKKYRSDQDNDTKINVVISNKEDGIDIEKTISASATLKTLFNDYANENGLSLRSLRFSFNGSTLFLSTAGNKTAKDLDIESGGIIEVSIVNSTAPTENNPSVEVQVAKGGEKEKKRTRSVLKSKQMNKGRQSSVVFNLETDRQRHSIKLTKVLDEMEPQLKTIRQNINESMLLCRKSKTRSPSRKSLDVSTDADFDPSMTGIGGKAGRMSFAVNVGKVENLYKTSKKDKLTNAVRNSRLITIDLHGCTQEEALERLNEWEGSTMDTAMKGEYPFVVQAVIVCGGGAQILSEVVENWIKEKKNVANAPKCSLFSQ